jgi:hypothetical protein
MSKCLARSSLRAASLMAFQDGQQLEAVLHVGLGQLHGHGAPVGQQVHQAFGGQHLDGFAQRCA